MNIRKDGKFMFLKSLFIKENKCILAKRTYGTSANTRKNKNQSILAERTYGNPAKETAKLRPGKE